MAHRLLQRYLDGGKSANKEVYEEQCDHCSEMEIFSVNAERDSIKFMQVKFMQDHQDQEFLGVISGVTDFGVFIEIVENKCEGMVRLSDIKEDHFEFDAKNFTITGRKTNKSYQLGDEVYVKVKNADLSKRQLDFTLIGSRDEIEN
jgi:ribonuclease R/exosome complex exonuclease DIS3/RRP44